MPFVTDTQLARVQSVVAGAQNKYMSVKAKAEAKAGEIKDLAEVVGGAAVMGYLRGMVEKSPDNVLGGKFVIPGTSIDIELLAGMGLTGAGMMDVFGKYDQDALMFGYGMLAHYTGQVSRNMGKSGSFTTVAGNEYSELLGDTI